ncbi:CARDB domain-containing protein [Natrialbaceae archaeon A-CW2]
MAVCLLLGLAVPTVAITVGSDPVNDEVALEPVDERYATIEDGKLTLTVDVFDNARTNILEVFTITIGDDVDGIDSVWIEHPIDGVEFYADGSEISNDSRLEPAAGEEITVGVLVDSTVTKATSETFSVHVAYEDDASPPAGPPAMPSPDPPVADDGDESDDEQATGPSLVALEVTPLELTAGESVTVTGTYEGGDSDEDVTTGLSVDGVVVSQQTVSVPADSTETVTFEQTLEDPGTVPVGIGEETRDVEVSAVETGEPAPNLTVSNVSLNTGQIQPGESVTLSADVTNAGELAGERTFDVIVGGFVVETVTVDLEPGESETVTLERTFENAGSYSLAFGGVDAGSVAVVEPTLVSASVTELPGQTGVALTVPILFGFGLLYSRRMGWL